MNGEESGRPAGKTAGLLAFPATETDRQQLSLFEDNPAEHDAELANVEECVRPVGNPPAAAQEPMLVPNADEPAPCSFASDDPDVWTEPKFYPYLIDICNECPFRQWCAKEALKMRADGRYQLVGLWAGVDFAEEDRGGCYRRRIQKLEHIAATGSAPRTRRSRRTLRSEAA